MSCFLTQFAALSHYTNAHVNVNINYLVWLPLLIHVCQPITLFTDITSLAVAVAAIVVVALVSVVNSGC